MIRQRANPITIIFFGMLVIIVGILVFTFCSFGTDTDAVMTGYETTRRYATDSKKLKASVDIFKKAVDDEIDYKNNIKNHEAVGFKDLPAYGTIADNSVYEAFSDSMVIKAGSGTNQDTKGKSPDNDIICSAKVGGGSATYFTYTGKKNNYDDGTLYMYGGYQCIGFANFLLSEVTGLKGEWDCNYGIKSPSKKLLAVASRWEAGNNSCKIDTAEKAKEFFAKVSPCTWVRTRPPAGATWGHSYTILGADEENLIIYDCNIDMYSGIQLRKVSWADVAKGSYFNDLEIIIAPNGYLPDGCFEIGSITGNNMVKKGDGT